MPLPRIQFPTSPRPVAWRTRRGLTHLRYFGDATGVVTGAINTAQGVASAAQASQAVTSLAQAQSVLDQASADLIALSNASAANATLQAQIGSQLNAANQQLLSLQNQLASQLNWWHSILAGTFPPFGIYQLSQVSTLLQQVSALQQNVSTMKFQMQQITAAGSSIAQGDASTYASLSAAAYASGDQATGDFYAQLAAGSQQVAVNTSTPQQQNIILPGNWFTENWMWIALGVGAFVIIKKL